MPKASSIQQDTERDRLMPQVALQGKCSGDEVLQCTQPTVAPRSLGSVFKYVLGAPSSNTDSSHLFGTSPVPWLFGGIFCQSRRNLRQFKIKLQLEFMGHHAYGVIRIQKKKKTGNSKKVSEHAKTKHLLNPLHSTHSESEVSSITHTRCISLAKRCPEWGMFQKS